jgi:hypothetical protein
MRRGLIGAILLAVLSIGAGLIWRQMTPAPVKACTAANPCRIHIRFGYTKRGFEGMWPLTRGDERALAPCINTRRDVRRCLLDRVAKENTAALRLAFQRSGLSGTAQHPTVLLDYSVATKPSDAYFSANTDVDAGPIPGGLFNRRLLDELNTTLPILTGRSQIVVVFSGLTGMLGGCVANSVSREGLVILPACLTNHYAAKPDWAQAEQLIFLHEVGHVFGAAHNDNGNPQPCIPGKGALSPPACAWEQRLDPGPTDRAALQLEPRAFCTLVGQYNYGGDTFCRAHRGGENGGGWIREYSHPGKCRTPGWEAYDCGDAGHDAVSVMNRRLPFVAARTAGRW